MFWGLVLKTGKRYSQSVSKAFHISHATLDVESGQLAENDIIQVWINTVDGNHLLCNLSKKNSQTTLDLAFSEGETISFFSKGAGSVHLTGFLLPDDDFANPEELDDEEEDEEETATLLKSQLAENDAEDDSESDDSDFDENALQEELEGSDEEDEEELEEEESGDEEEEEPAPRPAKIAKIDKKLKQNGLSNGKAPKAQEKKTKEVEKKGKEPEKKTVEQVKAGQKAKSRTLSGGVVVEDLRPGKGPEAKANKKVTVYYEGRLKSNNKAFDSTKAGEGFRFVLGRGEVIQGWDIGVAGMRVGGKRRITIPPSCGYGARGSPPTIPANATLVFDVELRGVN